MSSTMPLSRRRARSTASRVARLCAPAIILLVVFFALPLIGNAVRSFGFDTHVSAAGSNPLANYEKLFFDPYYRGVIFETLEVSFISTLLCLAIGYPVAHFMVRRAGRLAMPMLFLLIAPLLTSIIMRTFGWRVLFGRHGPVNGLLLWLNLIDRPLRVLGGPLGVYIGIVHVMVPFMVLSIVPVLRGVDRRLEESARILGAGAIRTFALVTLPLAVEGIMTGCVLVFMLTSGSFVTQLLLGDGSVVTLPLLIFQQFSLTQNLSFASAMGNLLLVIVLVCLYVQLRLAGGKGDSQ
jgi:putative spermidine/putrescine transport system permease protein